MRLEVQYQKATHQHHCAQFDHLYRVNSLSSDELIENLTALLTDTNNSPDNNIIFMSEDEICDVLFGTEVSNDLTLTDANVI